MHLLRVVDGPDMHVDPTPVSELDEPASDNRYGSEGRWHLQHVNVSECTNPGKTDDGLESRNSCATGAQVTADTTLHPLCSPSTERRDTHPVLHTAVKDQIGEWLDRRVGLGIDVDPGLREPLQHLIEPQDRIRAVDACFGDLGPREVDDSSGAVGHPVELVVVEGDQHTVSGGVDVGFEIAIPEFKSVPKRPFGVLRMGARTTSMGETDGSLISEVRVQHGKDRTVGTVPGCVSRCGSPRSSLILGWCRSMRP